MTYIISYKDFNIYVEPLNTNLKHKEILLKSHKTVIVPIFMYGYENLTSQQQYERLTERVETKCLRLFLGHALFNHKTNEEL